MNETIYSIAIIGFMVLVALTVFVSRRGFGRMAILASLAIFFFLVGEATIIGLSILDTRANTVTDTGEAWAAESTRLVAATSVSPLSVNPGLAEPPTERRALYPSKEAESVTAESAPIHAEPPATSQSKRSGSEVLPVAPRAERAPASPAESPLIESHVTPTPTPIPAAPAPTPAIALVDREVRMKELLARGADGYRAKDFEAAISAYGELIELDPKMVRARYNRALAHHLAGNYEPAIADFSAALELASGNPDAYYGRGLAEYMTRDFGSAIRDFSAAIERRPDYAAAYFNRALAHRQAGDLEAAKADFAKAAELDANYRAP